MHNSHRTASSQTVNLIIRRSFFTLYSFQFRTIFFSRRCWMLSIHCSVEIMDFGQIIFTELHAQYESILFFWFVFFFCIFQWKKCFLLNSIASNRDTRFYHRFPFFSSDVFVVVIVVLIELSQPSNEIFVSYYLITFF